MKRMFSPCQQSGENTRWAWLAVNLLVRYSVYCFPGSLTASNTIHSWWRWPSKMPISSPGSAISGNQTITDRPGDGAAADPAPAAYLILREMGRPD